MLKKQLILFLFLPVLIYSSDFSGGFKLGANISSLYGPDSEDLSSRKGFYAGIFLNYKINKYFSLGTEILSNSKGKQDIYLGLNAHYRRSMDLYYIEIPFLFKYTIFDHQSLKYIIFSGPYYGRFLGGVSSIREDGESEEYLLNGRISENDYGITFGAELDIYLYDFEKWYISLDLRHTFGLKSIDKIADESGNYDRIMNKTNSFIIGLGYIF